MHAIRWFEEMLMSYQVVCKSSFNPLSNLWRVDLQMLPFIVMSFSLSKYFYRILWRADSMWVLIKACPPLCNIHVIFAQLTMCEVFTKTTLLIPSNVTAKSSRKTHFPFGVITHEIWTTLLKLFTILLLCLYYACIYAITLQ